MSNASPKAEIQNASLDELADLSELFDLYRTFYGYAPDLDKAEAFLRERLEQGSSILLLARLQGRAVGFVQCYAGFSSLECKPSWLLGDLYVREEARGQGIGALLLEVTKQMALEAGCCVVELFTAKTNTVARDLYQSHGYLEDRDFLHYELFL
ncbi:GNAT family N-acetyltransferase [Marinobacterium sp. D7]|uniref:GNAT family N-acetyltransferase n=1 Tax=Marinobacterium ramblicola TaxID=2849041 RepID=UPI001C2CCAF1|nr:GNAT family N-acetyltransferase [Marinobacterium ramblicola]MBV1786652.1 GNAT family N-acetyltransferase [Marinobacterium ramblicola]